jgi:hypothetical protein
VLVSPHEQLAFRIVALNTEKADNPKDRSPGVMRVARNLAQRHPRAKEGDFEAQSCPCSRGLARARLALSKFPRRDGLFERRLIRVKRFSRQSASTHR